MVEHILRLEVGCSSGAVYRFFVKKFEKYKYRFRILDPSTARSEWGSSTRLRISQADLEYLRFDFPSKDGLQATGKNLADAIFQGDIKSTFERLIGTTTAKNTKLRLLFCCEENIHPLISSVPWECIFYKLKLGQSDPEHIGLSPNVSVARFISNGLDEYSPLGIEDKLVVLGVSSNPRNCARQLQGRAELLAVQHIADQRPDLIQFEQLPDARWDVFEQALLRVKPHVLFFSGHGQFVGEESHLLFQTVNADCDRIPISVFANTLANQPRLKVAILSACETGISIANNPFASAAHKLIEIGIPAVVAMQSRVVEAAAKAFCLDLFKYLFQEYPIDTCVNAGRLAVVDAEREYQGKGTQWAVPALYLSTMQDLIFDFSPSKEISAKRESKLAIMEDKFPRVSKQFIQRSRLHDSLAMDFSSDGVTVIHGPFGAGKTELISYFCTSMLRSPLPPGRDAREPLFFYVKRSKELTTFSKLLEELDKQSRGRGFEGFLEVLKQMDENDITSGIGHLRELLAINRAIIVFDEPSWNKAPFWRELFSQLVEHLRRSKVYFVTSSDELPTTAGDYSYIKVGGFEAEEAEKFLSVENRFDAETVEKMMQDARGVGYLPWNVKIIRDMFQGKPMGSGEAFIKKLDQELEVPERALLRQLSTLRQPVTLHQLAAMLDPDNPLPYLESAQALQLKSVFNFTHDLGVELPDKLKEYYSLMPPEEEALCHRRAAQFYEGQAAYGELG